jgi:hypothetical protein
MHQIQRRVFGIHGDIAKSYRLAIAIDPGRLNTNRLELRLQIFHGVDEVICPGSATFQVVACKHLEMSEPGVLRSFFGVKGRRGQWTHLCMLLRGHHHRRNRKQSRRGEASICHVLFS